MKHEAYIQVVIKIIEIPVDKSDSFECAS